MSIERETVLGLALALPGAAADQPFEGDFETTVLRHGAGGKWFGILLFAPRARVGLPGEGRAALLNLKCDPLVSYGLRQQYPDILPAYHMNKAHWISVRLEGDVPEDTVGMLIDMSYRLTRPKRGRQPTREV